MVSKSRYFAFVILLCTCGIHGRAVTPSRFRSARPIVLLGIPKETRALIASLKGRARIPMRGVACFSGRLRGRRVLVAQCGIGKVNAAMTTALMVERFRPRAVLFTGAAGGLNPALSPGDIVLGERTVQHDFGKVTPGGFIRKPTADPLRARPNPLFFPADPGLLRAADRASRTVRLSVVRTSVGARRPKILRGVVATGDVFVADPAKTAELRKSLKADAVEMEGAAVAQVCRQIGAPCLVIRCVSDRADAMATRDYERFLAVASENATRVTMETVRYLR